MKSNFTNIDHMETMHPDRSRDVRLMHASARTHFRHWMTQEMVRDRIISGNCKGIVGTSVRISRNSLHISMVLRPNGLHETA